MASDIFVAITSGASEIKGENYDFKAGDRIRSGHPLLKACPEYFVPARDEIKFDLETASAAPGEKRGQ
jgi:hypothetical protein